MTRGRTIDNAANLSPAAIRAYIARYGGMRLGRQELDGEIRIVVAIDPASTSDERSDETGIIVAGNR